LRNSPIWCSNLTTLVKWNYVYISVLCSDVLKHYMKNIEFGGGKIERRSCSCAHEPCHEDVKRSRR
jgi:hypothetical protein